MNLIKRAVSCMAIVGTALSAACAKKAPVPDTLLSKPDPAEQLKAAEEQVRTLPNFGNYINLGLIQLNKNNPEAALKSFQQAIAINPRSPLAHNNACAAYLGMKHWMNAIGACQAALRLEPGFQLAANNLRLAEKSLADVEKRISELKAKHRVGKEPGLLLQLGLEYYQTGLYEKAIREWRQVPRSDKSWALVQNNIASAAILLKDFKTARRAIEAALTIEPNNKLYQNNRAWLEQAEREAGRHPTGG